MHPAHRPTLLTVCAALRITGRVNRPHRTTGQVPAAFLRFSSRFSTTGIHRNQHVTIEEPGENGRRTLYYHLLPNSPRAGNSYKWALSFCSQPPSSGALNHSSILGVLPANHDDVTASQPSPSIENFEQNPDFVNTLHQAICSVLETQADQTLEAEAKARGEGWMHICDQRVAPVLNRIPDPEDILGSVLVENGEIIPSSYQVMPSYRVVSGESGPLILSDAIHSALTRLQKSNGRAK